MRYMLIKNGVVINAIVWDGPGENGENDLDFGEGVTYVGVDDDTDAGPGYLYKDGAFTRPPDPEPDHGDLVMMAEYEKQNRMREADSIFLEWQTKLILNMATDEQKASVVEWLNYKDSVKAVDTSLAPDITWPVQPAIPDEAK